MAEKGSDRLEEWFSGGTLVRPDHSLPGFVDLARALAECAGCKGPPPTEASEKLFDLIGPAEHYVFILVDGMGEEILGKLSPTGFLRRHMAQRLRAVFPSTTAAALTSLATADWPSRHGVCGWWMHLVARHGPLVPPGLSITTLPFVERFSEASLAGLGIELQQVFPLPSVWGSATRSHATFIKQGLEEGAFAGYSTGGGTCFAYSGLEEAFAAVTARIEGATAPTFTYLYLPHFDAKAHDEGVDAALPLLERLDTMIGRLAGDLAGKARMIVTADHGMTDLPEARVRIIEEDDELLKALIAPPTGEPTTPIFHLAPHKADRFLGRFEEVAEELFALITPDEIEELELLGPGRLSKASRARLGSFVGIAPEAAGLYCRRRGQDLFVHRGVHCGLSSSEMWIPLVLAG